MNKINYIKNEFKNSPDLITRKIKYGLANIYIIYLETVSSSDRVNNFILKNITNFNNKKKINYLLAAPNLKNITLEESKYYLYNGFSIVIYLNKIYALETKADLDRSIMAPQIEPSIYGPKDCLVENIQKNLGLIKRRIKSNHLKNITYNLGRYSKTITSLLYIDNITKMNLVNNIDMLLKQIDVDAIVDSGELKQYLLNENKNFFPVTKLTERPDTIVRALIDGKIVILVDTSPFAIVLPSVLADFINPVVDNYSKSNNVNFLKILRLLCFPISIMTPAYYIAIINFNQETIPSKLLISFINQRQGIPFPTTIEAFLMLFICEMLRESDIRFPNGYGASISILGALILGEAAVSANIVSPIMIIIVSLTFISSMVFNEMEISSAVRSWRFIFLLICSFYGLYGLILSSILLLINLCSYNSFGLPYMFPTAPFDLPYFKETLIKFRRRKDQFRSKYLSHNIRKQV